MDFFTPKYRTVKRGHIEVYPEFKVGNVKDLMVRGKAFYAVWDEEAKLWSTDECRLIELIDKELHEMYNKIANDPNNSGCIVTVKDMCTYNDKSKGWEDCLNYMKRLPESRHQLDCKVTFKSTDVKRSDYISKRLPYDLNDEEPNAWNELMSTLYSKDEREKIEWIIGSIIAGDSKELQKFLVLYGPAGTGKSTVINIMQKLFDGYWSIFDAKSLGSGSDSFALDAFSSNPLLAIQHDGDLSRIEDNTKLNSITAHETMRINEKFKSPYPLKINAMLIMGTNKPVKITDAKSGITRRLIDANPTGDIIKPRKYSALMSQIDFELGSIAQHCLDVYRNKGFNGYDRYKPIEMLFKTNPFFNFVEEQYYIFKKQNGTTLKQAWELYKTYCDEADETFTLPRYKFKDELQNYFEVFMLEGRDDEGKHVRNFYKGFKTDMFKMASLDSNKEESIPLVLNSTESYFDSMYTDYPAQYTTKDGTPSKKWENVKTTLSDIDTSRLHYVKVPENHIVIDFDLKDETGSKSMLLNLEAASKFPPTYAEFSKSGAGIHLHYIWDGNVDELDRLYSENIEIKVYKGNSSLRRKLSKCNNVPVQHLSSGLPLREVKDTINMEVAKDEVHLRRRITKALRKEIHDSTKPNIDYINKVLEDMYNSGKPYNVENLKPHILAFAEQSTHQSQLCRKIAMNMKYCSKDFEESMNNIHIESDKDYISKPIVFYDVEVFPNLFLVNWKFEGKEKPVVRMINPSPTDIEDLMKFRLVGFNCRRYDNHILWGRFLGFSNEQLYLLSQQIVSGKKNCFFGEAYNVSYTDVYDFCAKKQSLKKWEIELGIHHKELGLPWDEPVDESLWNQVAEYCDNDVIATEAVWNHCHADFVAREILADLAGMKVNDTTNSLTTRIIFGKEKNPNLVYTDLTTGKASDSKYERHDIITSFPDYIYEEGKNMFRGTDLGRGGYVYAEPGMYRDVALLDITSLHPHSIIAMNCFGEYTQNFKDLIDTRVYIKRNEFDKARNLFGGRLTKYLDDPKMAKDLAQALKIAINSVYGLTSASFDNPFRDNRNVNNIVALRGALFMRTLQDEVEKRGFKVAHIKTDSIKIPNATPEIIEFCMEFAKKYGYNFEHEDTYTKICLVNDAVYIAKSSLGAHKGEWTATGAEFQHPYIFKSLFSHKPIEFKDLCETKTVTSSLYLDMNEGLNPDEHVYMFVGKAGSFCPIKPGCGGGLLMREKDGKYSFATGSKGYRWLEAESVQINKKENDIDMNYFKNLANSAIDHISEFGDYNWFVSEDDGEVPWKE